MHAIRRKDWISYHLTKASLCPAGLSNGWERRHSPRRSVGERGRRLPLLQTSQKSDRLLQQYRQHAWVFCAYYCYSSLVIFCFIAICFYCFIIFVVTISFTFSFYLFVSLFSFLRFLFLLCFNHSSWFERPCQSWKAYNTNWFSVNWSQKFYLKVI